MTEELTEATHRAEPSVSAQATALVAAMAVVDERAPGAIVGSDDSSPESALVLRPEKLVEACRVLKADERLRFRLPLFCTAVDWVDREPRFDIVYQLRSVKINATIRLKIPVADRLDGGLPTVPSLAGVWQGMACHEREIFDLFGINFEGHPDMRRILMPEDWEGYPLRKDYVSFGEPVKFTDRGSFPPSSAVPEGSEQ